MGYVGVSLECRRKWPFFGYVSGIVLGNCVFYFAAFEGCAHWLKMIRFSSPFSSSSCKWSSALFQSDTWLLRYVPTLPICGPSNVFWSFRGYLGWPPSHVEQQHAALKPSKVWLSGASCLHLWWMRNVTQQQWLKDKIFWENVMTSSEMVLWNRSRLDLLIWVCPGHPPRKAMKNPEMASWMGNQW